MTQWKVKLTNQWDGKVEPFWNDRLSLWGVHEKGSISILRYIDGRNIGAIPLRLKPKEELLTCKWEPDDGDLFAVALKSGSIRIYKGRQDVEGSNELDGADIVGTIVLGRENWFTMEQFVWNRIKWTSNEPFKGDFDCVISNWLPKLTEMNISPQGKLTCSPLECEGPEWNIGLSENESNMFLTYDNSTRKVVLSIDGTFNFRYGEKNKFPSKITKILPGNKSNYVFLNDEDWQLQTIKLEFTESHQMHELMKSCSQVQFLIKYIKENHKVIALKLMEPHANFIQGLFPDEQVSNLLRAIKDVFYFGHSDEKSIESWLMLKVGRHGINVWKQRNHLFWSSTQGFLVTCMIPACERLVVAVKRLQGLIKSLKLTVFSLDDDEYLATTEVQELLDMSLEVLKEFVAKVEHFHIGEKMSLDGLTWIEYIMEHMLHTEDETSNSNGQDGLSAEDNEVTENYPRDHYSIQLFLQEYIIPSQTYNWIKASFPSKLEALARQFDLVQKNYTAKWIKKLIRVAGPIRKLKSIVGYRLEDAIVLGDSIYMICSKSNDKSSSGQDQAQGNEQKEADQSIDNETLKDVIFTLFQYDTSTRELTKQEIPSPNPFSCITCIKFVPGEATRFLVLADDGEIWKYSAAYSVITGVKNSNRITICKDPNIIMEPLDLEVTKKNRAINNKFVVHSEMAVSILYPASEVSGPRCRLAVQTI
ncbi:HBR025Wp [Eremothecium sinecaudum]|uniref:HBR025Wp n=1 Tax=Eremothecium sinecaudum TaxID=45286 RepID=A0A109UWM4_9SACH|nr:HBR025Wp [Eremothecium sinecaudum]AMD18926.1 HBR025Wp [Eremothecium sinecaudum]